MEYWTGVLVISGINLIAILGVALFTGFTGLFSFGHGGFMAIGAYASALFAIRAGVPVPLGWAMGAVLAGAVSVLIGYPALRLRGDYFVIATLGFGETIRLLVENSHKLTGGARGLPDIPPGVNIWVVLVLDLMAIIALRNFIGSRHGRNCVAVREEETAAETVGIDTTRYKTIALAISAGLAGLSGALMASWIRYLHPSMFGLNKSTEITIAVILGGQGTLTGAVLAAMLLIPLPEVLRMAQEWRLVAYGLIVVLISVLRPEGLFGYREITFEGFRRLCRRPPSPPSGPVLNGEEASP